MTAPNNVAAGRVARLLIANRGEIAIRIARTARELGIDTVAIHSADDAGAPHTRAADRAVALTGIGPAAYLDVGAVVAAAVRTNCDTIHPGYGFLAESAELAAACAAHGIRFAGPGAAALRQFGDKRAAKELAARVGVPILAGADGADLVAARALLAEGPVMVKAVAGGGGRGIRRVADAAALEAAIRACAAEAAAAFGSGAVIIERCIDPARHIEVQVVADSEGAVATLGTRDCSLQRRHQKLLEIAPAPALAPALEARLCAAAARLIAANPYQGLATVEFLVDPNAAPDSVAAFAFLEVNPRIQVEHTVSEEVYGVDLVAMALQIVGGATLDGLGLSPPPAPRGTAIQCRIFAERIDAAGNVHAAPQPISRLLQPGGAGIRIDAAGGPGDQVNPRFDSLLAKLVVHADSPAAAIRRARRALAEYAIDGPATSLPLLRAILARPELAAAHIDTGWFERTLPELLAACPPPAAAAAETAAAPPGTIAIAAPLTAALVALEVAPGAEVRRGQPLAVLEALKMQHLVEAPRAGVVRALAANVGDVVAEGAAIAFLEPAASDATATATAAAIDPDYRRPDLAELDARIALTLDASRPDAVARRRQRQQRTARENLDDLFDAGSFVEYGGLAIATGWRGTPEELMRTTPADGLVTGIGTVNAAQFGAEAAKCAGLAYDFTVIAGTQGRMNHAKTDRIVSVADRLRIPVVFYAEGGGGRPGDGSEGRRSTGLTVPSFHAFAALAGRVPRIGVTSGRCFAGNAVFLGLCDLIVATENSNIGLGGPAMIEGGGLGSFRPEEVGPIDVMWENGSVDLRLADEAKATACARRLLGYFQGRLTDAPCADQRLLRQVVPENRLRVFDIHQAIELLADRGSWLELRAGFGVGMITGLVRVEGRPMGLIANNCRHLSGAIDADGAEKAADFLQFCDRFRLPVLSLCDTPGFIVGPEAERAGTVRRAARMYSVAAGLRVPIFAVVIRKGYGLGAMAMTGGSFHASAFTISWPTGEFGGMGLEGAVRLGHKRELDAIADARAREARYQELVALLYADGKAVSAAQFIDIDAVIDPADTRTWIGRGLASMA